jgi:MFS superfamily sulfate permease-like transporter
MRDTEQPVIEPVQAAYAKALGVAVLIGFVLLFAGFALYASGALPSVTSIGEVPELWHLSAGEFAAQTSQELGWAWVRGLGQGDQLAFATLIYFPAATLILVVLAGILYARHRIRSYAIIALLEGLVLLVAATGLFSAGH